MWNRIRKLWWKIFKPEFDNQQQEILWELDKGLRNYFVLLQKDISYKIYWNTLSNDQKQFIRTLLQKSIDNKSMKTIMDDFNDKLQNLQNQSTKKDEERLSANGKRSKESSKRTTKRNK